MSVEPAATREDAEVQALGADFWSWRAATQPVTPDDLPRIARPAGWAPDWSDAAVVGRIGQVAGFRRRLENAVAEEGSPTVGWSLVACAIRRAEWELTVLRSWERDPLIAVRESLGALLDLLVRPPETLADACEDVRAILEATPALVESLTQRLTAARAPFAQAAIEELHGVEARLMRVVDGLAPLFDPAPLRAPAQAAGAALGAYRGRLQAVLPELDPTIAIGAEGYGVLLSEIGHLPLDPHTLRVAARAERDRVVAAELIERNRNRARPETRPLATLDEQLAAMARAEEEVRAFYEQQELLSVPQQGRYAWRPMPAWIEPLADIGNTSFLGDPLRPAQPAYRYVRPPREGGGYFGRAAALDPRTTIAHEGMHVLQLACAWQHEDPLRRRFYDSSPNEGIALYAESLLLQAGLFDDRPRTRELMHNLTRLRAIRAEVDVHLALGEWSVDEAARELATQVPMDLATARAEAVFFATSPGQAASYLAGRLEVERLLAAARRLQGEAFSLRAFHDRLLREGNVPIALQERELHSTDHDERTA